MKYERFVIQNYKANKGPLEIDVSRRRLHPIIGINESGKTTVLHAISVFDWMDGWPEG
jgi:predicted ATP-dependent endonuclease of OLD family